MKVRDVMLREARSCGPGTSLARVGRIMAEVGCGMLPVLGGDDGAERVVGVITDRDVCLALTERDVKASLVEVRLVMSGEVYSCQAGDELTDALETLRERKVRRLVVLDDHGGLAGLLSLDDVVVEAPAALAGEIAATLKAINQHPALAVRS